MYDYSPLAFVAFSALTLTLATALMFLLAWMESTLPGAPLDATDALRAAERSSGRDRPNPVSFRLNLGSEQIMTVGPNPVVTR